MEEILQKFLNYYEISFEEYKNEIINDVNFSVFDFVLENIEFLKAKNILLDSLSNHEKIVVFGDYDCDGILSTSIIYKLIEKLGAIPGFYIPFRKTDGYGISMKFTEKFVELGYKLVILVDNGITLNEPIAYLKQNGVKVIIIDHHQINEIIPNADAIIHRDYLKFCNHNISAGATSFLFSYVVLNKVDEYLLTLGGITLLSDLMPMIKINRDIVKLALKSLNKRKYNNIIELIGEVKSFYKEDDLYLKAIPKINSIGRIVDDNKLFQIVYFFIENDNAKNHKRAEWISFVNEERKNLISNENISNYDTEDPVLFIKTNLNEGLIGLLANRILDLTNKPTFVFADADNGVLKGSARSKQNFNIVDSLNYAKELLLTFGGHNAAGGLSLKNDDYNKFKQRILEYYLKKADKEVIFNLKTIEIDFKEISKKTYDFIEIFSPYGKEHEKPVFKLKNISTKSFLFSKDGKHIITKISFDGKILYFNFPDEILHEDYVNLTGYIEDNTFMNRTSYVFRTINYEKI